MKHCGEPEAPTAVAALRKSTARPHDLGPLSLKYQLVLQFAAHDLSDYDQMIALEDALITSLGSSAIVDGHDFGSGEMNIFVHTNSPSDAFNLCLAGASASGLLLLAAAFRPLGGDEFTRLWPLGSEQPFRVI